MHALCTTFSEFSRVAQKMQKSSEIRRFRNFPGGDKRDRTADLLNAIQALSQLSYTPILERWAVSSRRFQVRVY